MKLSCRARHTRHCHCHLHGTLREGAGSIQCQTGFYGFYAGNQILLSHLQMGFWRLQSLPERSQSWKETRKRLRIHSTMYSSLLMERTFELCQLEAPAYASD